MTAQLTVLPTASLFYPGTPDGTYWLVNVARAQHARAYSWTGPSPTPPPDVLSPPLPASAIAQGYAPGATVSHNGTACGLVDGASPTFLSKYFGNPWGCYWEYVWQGQAYPYMHRPLDWGVLEFREQAAAAADAAGATSLAGEASGVLAPAGAAPCFDVVFPGRHVAKQLFYAQKAFAGARPDGAFSSSVAELAGASGRYCQYMNETEFWETSGGGNHSKGFCLLADLRYALSATADGDGDGGNGSRIFAVTTEAQARAPAQYDHDCEQAQCFTAEVKVARPGYSYTVRIDQNMRVQQTLVVGDGQPFPCLNEEI